MGTDVAVQAGIYDYFFKQLLHAERLDDARAILLTFLGNLEQSSGAVDPGQADVVRFYLSCL